MFLRQICFFKGGLGFKLKASCVQSTPCTIWITSPVHFALVILEMGVSWTVYHGWPRTTHLPISASQVARIIGVSNSVWLGQIVYSTVDHVLNNCLIEGQKKLPPGLAVWLKWCSTCLVNAKSWVQIPEPPKRKTGKTAYFLPRCRPLLKYKGYLWNHRCVKHLGNTGLQLSTALT
jgi:hypothetical protein